MGKKKARRNYYYTKRNQPFPIFLHFFLFHINSNFESPFEYNLQKTGCLLEDEDVEEEKDSEFLLPDSEFRIPFTSTPTTSVSRPPPQQLSKRPNLSWGYKLIWQVFPPDKVLLSSNAEGIKFLIKNLRRWGKFLKSWPSGTVSFRPCS